jgi:hypothetical protein
MTATPKLDRDGGRTDGRRTSTTAYAARSSARPSARLLTGA